MLAVIPKLLLTLYYPRFARAHAAGGTKLQHDFTMLLKTTSALGLPVIFLTIVLSPEIIAVLYGSGYEPSVLLLRLLAIAALPLLWAAGLPSMLMAARQERAALHCFGIAMLLNVTLNLALIPRFAGVGAAFVTLVAESSVLATGVFYVQRHLNVKIPPLHELLGSLWLPLIVGAVAATLRFLSLAAGLRSAPIVVGLAVSGSALAWVSMTVFLNARNGEH